MDYSQNPYHTPKPEPGGAGKTAVYVVFGLCGILLIGILLFAYSGLVDVVSRPSGSGTGSSAETAKILKTAEDGWITYKLNDAKLTVELPARVELRSEDPSENGYSDDEEGYRSIGEAAYVMIARYDFDRRYVYTAKMTKEYDLDYHLSYVDKGTLTTDFKVSEIATIPAYHAIHTYVQEGVEFECHAYYIVGSDWLAFVDIGFPVDERKVGESEMQRVIKSMKFEKLDGLVRQL